MGWHGGGFHRHGFHRGRQRNQEEMERTVSDTVLLKRLLTYLSPYRLRIIVVTLLTIGSTLINLITPKLTMDLIDDILTPVVTIGSLDTEALMGWIILYVGIIFTRYIIRFFQTYLMSYIGQNVLFKIRSDLFDHLQALSLRFFVEGETGRIMSVVTNDVEELNRFLNEGMFTLITDFVSIVGAIFFMFTMNVELSLISLAMVPLMFIVFYLMGGRARRAWRRTRESIAGVTSRLQEGISGIRVTQAFSREDINIQTFEQTNVQNLQASLRAQQVSGLFGVGMRLSTIIGVTLILWFSVSQILSGHLTIGALTAFQRYLMMFIFPLMSISNFYNMYQSVMAGLERIFKLIDTPIEVNEAELASRVNFTNATGAIEYRNVSFSYESGVPVLKNISLSIKPNEKLAFVGPTGAGKSTMVNLLCRFYDPTEGTILLDGQDIRQVSHQSLRQHMGIVLQDTFLFPDTVRENIRYGRPEATDEKVRDVAKIIGAHDFIMRLPQGYDMVIQEGANNISIGQRQLISFARALLINPRILVLDEATSSVDPYTELVIQEALEKLLANRTSIIIAH
ncbi:MAG: ABC transporter ATP-binding protein/permease, partial [Candidatus Bathyarchaeota archaeon]|nr:ABC transporter ATP-binding protein/permease [Candidatus Bathyarchaeota archaeon]